MAATTSSSSSTNHQLLHLYQRLYLPALSLVFLTGFTFSITLPPSALQALTPAMESLFLVSLPHLWKSFLSWVTPPCLFVLLNGIIMILTATSGSFSRPASSSSGGGSDLYSTLQKHSAVLEPTAAILADEPHGDAVNHGTPPVMDPPIQALLLEGPIVSRSGIVDIPATSICLHADDEVLAEELPKEVSSSGGGGGGDGSEDQDKDMEMHVTSQDVPKLTVGGPIVDDVRYEIDGGDDDPSSSSCEKEAVMGRSEPSSPLHFSSSPALKKNIRRACSIDFASLHADNEEPSEYLSDDAFKKRIEDFIFKVNSKIRSETRL